MEAQSYTFVEELGDVRAVRLDPDKESKGDFILSWKRENGTVVVVTMVKLSLEAVIATQEMLTDFINKNKHIIAHDLAYTVDVEVDK